MRTWKPQLNYPKLSCYNYNSYVCGDSRRIKGVLSGQTQFLATERPLKNMKNAFYFTSKALSVLKLLKFLS